MAELAACLYLQVAKEAAETVSQQGEQIGKTEAFQKIKAVRKIPYSILLNTI